MRLQEGTIPAETFRKAQVTTLDEALAAANRIGYPVMVKASEGGGGKGIRMSHSDEDMRSHFVQVRVVSWVRALARSLPPKWCCSRSGVSLFFCAVEPERVMYVCIYVSTRIVFVLSRFLLVHKMVLQRCCL